MDIWNKLSLDPEGLVEWYKERRNLMEQIGKAEAYNVIRASYNANPNGADFYIFLELVMEELSDSESLMVLCQPPVVYTLRYRLEALKRE